jgi:hypothetical protein
VKGPAGPEADLVFRKACIRILASTFVVLLGCAWSREARAGGRAGDFVQTDSVGVNVVNRDFSTHTTTTVSDAFNLSEYFGVHYYFADGLRLGATFQWSERITPAPTESATRIQRLAVLPQIGWHFCDPFYVAVVYGIAPYTRGKPILDMTVEGVLGASFPLSDRVRFSLSATVPYAFYYHRALGLTPIAGLSFRL